MAVDPNFVKFFEGAWGRALDRVEIPGIEGASWDRKAAYLLYLATDQGRNMPALPKAAPAVSEASAIPDGQDVFG